MMLQQGAVSDVKCSALRRVQRVTEQAWRGVEHARSTGDTTWAQGAPLYCICDTGAY